MKLYDVMRREEEKELKQREKESQHYDPDLEPPHRRHPFTKKSALVYGGCIIFLGALYAIGIQLASAKVIITERRIPFSLSRAEIELSNQDKADEGRLSFQAMAVTTTITREVYGSAMTNSNTKATGSVVFFNEYSTKKQTIAKGKTLTASNGKKYVTQAAATVPGYTTVNKKKVAGTSPSIAIAAADVGESYNSEGTTLSVAGYGKTLYARSTAITGGEAGVSHTLTETERAEAISMLQTQLIEKLKRETRAQIPEELMTLPELQFPLIDAKSFSAKGGGVRFPAQMTGTMVSYLVPRALLEQAVAAKSMRDQETYPNVSIPDLADLTFDLRSAVPTDPKAAPDAVTVVVSGSATAITKVPVDKVKELLVGAPRRRFTSALESIPEIDTARFSISPFWSPRFPVKPAKIIIEAR